MRGSEVNLLILFLCLAFFGGMLFLITQNGAPVDVEILFLRYKQVPLSVLMTICLLSGIGFAALLSFLDGARMRLQNKRLRRQIERLELDIQLFGRQRPKDSSELRRQEPPRDYAGHGVQE